MSLTDYNRFFKKNQSDITMKRITDDFSTRTLVISRWSCFESLPAIVQYPQAAAAGNVARVGDIISLSDPSASVGEQGKNARDMAVEEINAAE
jgi:ABC-type branched-subunit amino acid transport system substrate-binding protein